MNGGRHRSSFEALKVSVICTPYVVVVLSKLSSIHCTVAHSEAFYSSRQFVRQIWSASLVFFVPSAFLVFPFLQFPLDSVSGCLRGVRLFCDPVWSRSESVLVE